MNQEKPAPKVTSLSGSPIFMHGEASPWKAPVGEEFIEEISAHIEKHVGPVETVFHELVSDTVHIDIHCVKPTSTHPYVRLVTSGMGDLPMTTPDDPDVPKYAELMMTLPAGWHLDQKSFEDERWYWPVRLLKTLARLPHKHQTWLGWGHTVPNGNPPEPYAPGTDFCGAIVLSPASTPPAFHKLRISSSGEIAFYAVVPLYETEMNLKLRSGTNALLKRFEAKQVSDVVVLGRKDVSRKTFGLW